jgi:hypothetical protein
MKNYAGHRLSPWLGHLMVSRQETARPLLTPGEVMQLPPDDELVLVSGCQPVRAKKARYYEDQELNARILPSPELSRAAALATSKRSEPPPAEHDWTCAAVAPSAAATEDPANSGIRREPELPDHGEIAPEPPSPIREFDHRMRRATTMLHPSAPFSVAHATSRGRRVWIRRTTWASKRCARNIRSACLRTLPASSRITPRASTYPRRSSSKPPLLHIFRRTAPIDWRRPWRGGSTA